MNVRLGAFLLPSSSLSGWERRAGVGVLDPPFRRRRRRTAACWQCLLPTRIRQPSVGVTLRGSHQSLYVGSGGTVNHKDRTPGSSRVVPPQPPTCLSFFSSTDSDDATNIVDDELAACWSADSWSVNPDGDTRIDDILQALHSPAPQGFFVIERALQRPSGDITESVLRQCQYLVKDRYQFCFRRRQDEAMAWNVPRHRPGVDWSVVPTMDDDGKTTAEVGDGWQVVRDDNLRTNPSASQIAANVLDLVTVASETQRPVDENAIQQLLQQLKRRLDVTLGTDLRGRTAADTAFALSLAGVANDSWLYERLATVTLLELHRVRRRSARRTRDVLHVVEKLTAAGVRGPTHRAVCHLAQTALNDHAVAATLTDPRRFHMTSTRPLLWLWRFAARQPKATVPSFCDEYHDDDSDAMSITTVTMTTMSAEQTTRDAAQINNKDHQTWLDAFEDPSKPLVVDIGCGMGLSLLGLASLEDRMSSSPEEFRPQQPILPDGIEWKDCNFLGGDLSLLGTRFGQGMATRWNLGHRLQYTMASAEDLLDQVDKLYDKVSLIMIQFASPYRLKETSGNAQLPSNADTGFMVTPALMRRVASVAKRSQGRVLLQSNCEDVAVTLHDLARAAGLVAVPAVEPVLSVEDDMAAAPHQRTPQRTLEWIRMGGKRALGPQWSRIPLLPEGCGTETEASCTVHETPVHRCCFH